MLSPCRKATLYNTASLMCPKASIHTVLVATSLLQPMLVCSSRSNHTHRWLLVRALVHKWTPPQCSVTFTKWYVACDYVFSFAQMPVKRYHTYSKPREEYPKTMTFSKSSQYKGKKSTMFQSWRKLTLWYTVLLVSETLWALRARRWSPLQTILAWARVWVCPQTGHTVCGRDDSLWYTPGQGAR